MLLSSLHGNAGLVVSSSPVVHVALIQVLVSQNQRTETIACIFLESLQQLQTKLLISIWSPVINPMQYTHRKKPNHSTHTKVVAGKFLEFATFWMESFIDDGVCSFAIQSQLSIRAPHWELQTGQNLTLKLISDSYFCKLMLTLTF